VIYILNCVIAVGEVRAPKTELLQQTGLKYYIMTVCNMHCSLNSFRTATKTSVQVSSVFIQQVFETTSWLGAKTCQQLRAWI
jgi:hypothetical protein